MVYLKLLDSLGLISSRCSGNEPVLPSSFLGETERAVEIEPMDGPVDYF